MKMLRKSLSILLVAAMLMSVCTCLFGVIGGSAYTVTDEVMLALDFEDEKGIADVRPYTTQYDFEYQKGTQKDGTTGTYPVFTSISYQGWSSVIGNENAVAADSVADKPHADRFQVTKAGTYTLKFDYKYFAGSSRPASSEVADNDLYFQIYRCQYATTGGSVSKSSVAGVGFVDFSNLTEGTDYEAVTDVMTSDGTTEYTRYKLLKDTEWKTATLSVTFSEADITAGRTSLCITTSGGAGTYVGDTNGFLKLAVDNVFVSDATAVAETDTNTYVYDFKDATGAAMASDYAGAGHANFANSGTGGNNVGSSYIGKEGMVFNAQHSAFPAGGYNWGYKAYLKDPDFQLGSDTTSHGWFRIDENSTYYISMKYKLGETGTSVSKVNVGIGLTTGTASGTVTIGTRSKSYDTVAATDKSWHTVSVVIDSDTYFVSTSDTSNVNKYVCIMACGGTTNGDATLYKAEVIIESVTVTVVDKTEADAQETQVVADFDEGLNDVYMPLGNRLNNGTYAIVNDPLNTGRGNVLQFTTTQSSTFNFAMPAVTGQGGFNTGVVTDPYKVVNGHTYRVSYDIYLQTPVDTDSTADAAGVGGVAHYLANADGIANSGNKIGNLVGYAVFTNGDDSYAVNRRVRSSNITGQWVNVTYEYTCDTNADTYPYIIIALACVKGAVYCFDNVTVTDITAESQTEGTVILDTQKGTMSGETTVTLPVGEIYNMPTPTREGYVFAGWTKSWDIANGMTFSEETSVQNVIDITADNASRTVLTVEPGVARYYAIWAEAKITYEFNDLTKYLGSTFGQTGAGQYSSGNFYGEDLDGDGDYDAIGLDKAALDQNAYSINLGETKEFYGVSYYDMFTLREGVTYKITFNKKIDKLSTTKNKATIGLTRGMAKGYGNVPVDGGNGYTYQSIGDFTEAETAYSDYSYTFSVFGLFNTSYNGSTASGGYPLKYKDSLHFIVANGSILFNSITVEAVSYDDGTLEVNGGEAEVDVDYENKTVTVTPAKGYSVASNGVEVFNNYYFGTAADLSTATLAYKVYGTADCTDLASYTFSYANNTELFTPDDGATVRVIVNLIEDTTKRSIRAEATDPYQSAGLRFRYTLTDAQIEGATEIGFIMAPDAYATEADWYKNADGTKVKSGVVYNGTTDIVYATGDGTKDYQLIITGLTREGATNDAKGLKINVVMYVTTETETVYYYVGASDYNAVKDAYAAGGTTTDANGNAY